MMVSGFVAWIAAHMLFGAPFLVSARPFTAEKGPDRVALVAAAPLSDRGGDLEGFIRLYQADHAAVDRFYNLPWSETRFDRLKQVCRDGLERMEQVDFDRLTQQGRIDFILLRNHLNAQVSKLARERRKLAEMEELLPFRRDLLELESARRRMEPVDPRASATKLAGFVEQVKEVRKRIEQGRQAPTTQEAPPAEEPKERASPGEPLLVSAVAAWRAAAAVDALRRTLGEWYGFYDGYEPDFSWWIEKPYEEAGRLLDDYAKYLRQSIAGIKGTDDDPLVGDPIGAEALASDLAAEMLPYTPEELIAIGEAEFAWCEAEMKKASADMGLGDDWKTALAKVKEDHVPPGQQDDLVAAQVRSAIRFLKDRRLVTVPPLCEETWRVTMISPQTQKVLPFAAYGGQTILVAYPTDGMKHDDKLMSMRGNNRHVTRVFALHELIPGHHLQAFMAERHRPYRAMFSSPFFVEGWALYWEMTFYDMGYAPTPEDRIGMLHWRMHRAARIIVSLKFHLGRMTPAEMVDFLVERVGHERLGATSEVRRFIGEGYAPLYQCGYMIGGLQLRALRRELVDTGRLSEREFHDALLTYGAIPVELVRAGMLNLPLTPETKASWRFAGEAPGR